MNPGKICGHRTTLLLTTLLAGAGLLGAADDATTTAASPATVTAASPVAKRRDRSPESDSGGTTETASGAAADASEPTGIARKGARLATGDGNPGHLRQRSARIGQVASTEPDRCLEPRYSSRAAAGRLSRPVAISDPAATGRVVQRLPGNPCEAPEPNGPVPAYLRLGSVCITPIGFMDLTPFWRDKNAGSSMGSNFGSVPYNNAANGNLSEFHFSMQNSRLGLRVDGDWKGTHFIGYNEFDFNGTSGATNLAVSNGAIVPRLRLFWVDVRKDKSNSSPAKAGA